MLRMCLGYHWLNLDVKNVSSLHEFLSHFIYRNQVVPGQRPLRYLRYLFVKAASEWSRYLSAPRWVEGKLKIGVLWGKQKHQKTKWSHSAFGRISCIFWWLTMITVTILKPLKHSLATFLKIFDSWGDDDSDSKEQTTHHPHLQVWSPASCSQIRNQYQKPNISPQMISNSLVSP